MAVSADAPASGPGSAIDHSTHAARPLASYSLDELAMVIRPYVDRDGYDYAMEEPDYETAKMILENLGKVEGTVTTPPREGRDVIGDDTRTYNGNNTTFPQTTYLFGETGCTATMISPSVALTAAHCLWDRDTGSWTVVDKEPGLGAGTRKPRWTAAVDGRDTDPFPFTNSYMAGAYEVNCNNVPSGPTPPYTPNCTSTTTTFNPGSHIECYTRAISQSWKDSNPNTPAVEFDYGFLDFSSCGASPGDWLGFMGVQTLTKSQIESGEGYISGYPWMALNAVRTTLWWAPPSDVQPAWQEAEIWGTSGPVTVNNSSDPILRYTMDASAGQSGAAVWRVLNGTRVVYGHHKGQPLGEPTNLGRRFDTGVRSFAILNTVYPD